MKILRVMLLASAALSAVVPAAAEQGAAPSAEAIAAAKELVAVTSPDMVKDLKNRLFRPVWPSMEQSLRANNPQLDAATAETLKTEIDAAFEKELAAEVPGLMETIPAIYARYLTEQEMRDIAAFYRTPAGAKALKVMPQITGESMGQINPRLQGALQRINVSVLDILKKHGLEPK
jgi:hypothetical protein